MTVSSLHRECGILNLRFYSSIFLVRLRKTTKNLRISRYELEMLTLQHRFYVNRTYRRHFVVYKTGIPQARQMVIRRGMKLTQMT